MRGEGPADVAEGAGQAVGHEGLGPYGKVVRVEVGEVPTVRAEGALAEQGVVAGPPIPGVVGGDQVHGAAHEVQTDERALFEQTRELVWVEVAHPGPESGERLLRLLGLEAAEVGDDVGKSGVGAVQQELAGQGRAVEGAGAEAGGHVYSVLGESASACHAQARDTHSLDLGKLPVSRRRTRRPRRGPR